MIVPDINIEWDRKWRRKVGQGVLIGGGSLEPFDYEVVLECIRSRWPRASSSDQIRVAERLWKTGLYKPPPNVIGGSVHLRVEGCDKDQADALQRSVQNFPDRQFTVRELYPDREGKRATNGAPINVQLRFWKVVGGSGNSRQYMVTELGKRAVLEGMPRKYVYLTCDSKRTALAASYATTPLQSLFGQGHHWADFKERMAIEYYTIRGT